MDKITVYGLKNVDYVSRKTGRPVQGMELSVLMPDQFTEGLRAERIFVSRQNTLFDPPRHLPCSGVPSWNRYGGLDFITWDKE